MNETINVILRRRSSRKFKQEKIKDDELQIILEAGKHAPSAMNQQPWHFTVIQNTELLKSINEMCKTALIKAKNKRFEEMSDGKDISRINLFFNAQTLIIVSGNEKAIAPMNDCNLAIENMLIAAESLGIGSCWIQAIYYLYSDIDGKDFLIKGGIIPKGNILIGSAVFGYKTAEVASAPPRRENTVTIIK